MSDISMHRARAGGSVTAQRLVAAGAVLVAAVTAGVALTGEAEKGVIVTTPPPPFGSGDSETAVFALG